MELTSTTSKRGDCLYTSSRETHDYQVLIIKRFSKARREIEEKFELSKQTIKYFDTVGNYLDTYLIVYDSLLKISEVLSTIMKSNELETVEREMKVLHDTFWD